MRFLRLTLLSAFAGVLLNLSPIFISVPAFAGSPCNTGIIRWFKDGQVLVDQSGKDPFIGRVETGSTACLYDPKIPIAADQWAVASEITSQPWLVCSSGFGVTWPRGGTVFFKDGRKIIVGNNHRACLLPNTSYRVAVDQWVSLGSIEFIGNGYDSRGDDSTNSANSGQFIVEVEGTGYPVNPRKIADFLMTQNLPSTAPRKWVYHLRDNNWFLQFDPNPQSNCGVRMQPNCNIFEGLFIPDDVNDPNSLYLDKSPLRKKYSVKGEVSIFLNTFAVGKLASEDFDKNIAHETSHGISYYRDHDPNSGGEGPGSATDKNAKAWVKYHFSVGGASNTSTSPTSSVVKVSKTATSANYTDGFSFEVDGSGTFDLDFDKVHQYLVDAKAPPRKITFRWRDRSWFERTFPNDYEMAWSAAFFVSDELPHPVVRKLVEKGSAVIYFSTDTVPPPPETYDTIVAHELFRFVKSYRDHDPNAGGGGQTSVDDPSKSDRSEVNANDRPIGQNYHFTKNIRAPKR